MTLEDSATYQWILQKGEAKGEARGATREAHRLVVQAGIKRFGPPPVIAQAALDAITDRERLERMLLSAFDVESWDALLATP